jgi:hypothetical protein
MQVEGQFLPVDTGGFQTDMHLAFRLFLQPAMQRLMAALDGFLARSLFLASFIIFLTRTSIVFFILLRNFRPLKSGSYSQTIT